MSCEQEISQTLVTLVSVFQNILIWESSMIQPLVSMEWISTAACKLTWMVARIFLTENRTRPGARVARRRRAKTPVGRSHQVMKTDTIKWFKSRFEGIVR